MTIKSNNLSLRQLRAFSAVGRNKSFVAASRELFITQSALSETIRQLEQNLGIRLFDRTTRSVHLSAAGEEFMTDVMHILRSLDEAVQKMDDIGSVLKGTVRVAGATSVLACLFVPALRELLASHPKLKFELTERGPEEIVESVRRGEADFGVGAISPAMAHDLAQVPFLTDRYGLIALKGHQAFARKSLSLGSVGEWPYICLLQKTLLETFAHESPDAPTNLLSPAIRINNTGTLRALLEEGVGVSVLPALAVQHLASPKLDFGIFERPRYERKVIMVHRTGRSLSPAAQLLWDQVCKSGKASVTRPGIRFDN